MKKIFLLLVTVQIFGICTVFGQINVLHIDNNASPLSKEGIFYSLPRTVVKVDVRIDRVENFRGPYADFALRFLGLKNVISANSIEYRISEISITTYPEPDPEQYYFIELGDKISKGEKDGLLSLSDAGLILGTIEGKDDSLTAPMRVRKTVEAAQENDRDAFGQARQHEHISRRKLLAHLGLRQRAGQRNAALQLQ